MSTIIRGGKTIPVILRDGTAAEIFVKKVSFLKVETLARAWGKTDKELEVYTGLTADELEATYSDEALVAIHKEGRDLNFFILQAFNAETKRTWAAMDGDQAKLAEALIQKVISQESGQTLPAPASPTGS